MKLNEKSKIAVIISCGIGDAHTYMARLPALCYIENINKVDMYIVGGYRDIPVKVKELLSLSNYIDDVYITDSINKSNYSKVLDWRPDDAPLNYGIQIPFETPYKKDHLEDILYLIEDRFFPIIVQPYSTGGNARGEQEKIIRSASEKWWVNLIDRLKSFGTTPIIVGGDYDEVDWSSYGVEVDTFYGRFLETIPLILNSNAFIGTNSWCWQVAYYAGIRTSCLYIYPQQHLRLHLARKMDNLTIFKEIPSIDRAIESLYIPKKEYKYCS